MGRIVFVRHGIAHDRTAPDCPPDFERALTAEGQEKTVQAAMGLRLMNLKIDRVYQSPLVRAVQTADLLNLVLRLGQVPRITTDALEPLERPEEILKILEEERPRCALLVGHAPHCDELLTHLLSGGDDAGVNVWMKKASAACVDIERPTAAGTGLLRWLMPPKALRAIGSWMNRDYDPD